MTKLSELAIEAHGGLHRWRQFEQVTADLRQGGALWSLKGQPETLQQTTVTAGLRKEWASHAPFGADRRRSRFEPGQVALESADGTVQLAYFAGCAMWTYLNTPFVLAWPGVESEEMEPLRTSDGLWRRLAVRFPKDIATHSAVQTLYFDADGLMKRHDYDVEISGNTPGAHLIEDYVEVSGIRFPTKRRIFARQPDGSFSTEPLVVSIDLSNIRLS
jgi:hypothetical protein